MHQEVVLCPHLTVAANMFLGEETSTASGCCKDRAMVRRAQAILDEIGFNLPAGAPLEFADHRPAAARGDRPRRRCAARAS